MSAFDLWVDKLLKVEGGYTNDPTDMGGATKYGITEKTAREEGYTGQMQDLSIDIAKTIYKRRYWDKLRLDEIAISSEKIAREMGDTYVNTGIGATFLQRMLNVLNHQGRDYPDITVDGNVGPATISAFRSYLVPRGQEGEQVLLTALNCLQANRYIELAENKETQEKYIYGWLLQRVVKEA